MSVDLSAAADFLAGSARVLDRRRFELLFDGGDPAAVLAAVDGYRNRDGGYGWGLEPDLRSRTSQPGGALHAFEVFADLVPVRTARAAELCDWLASVSLPDRGLPFALPVPGPGRLRAVLGVGGRHGVLAADHRGGRGGRAPGGRRRRGGGRPPVADPGDRLLPRGRAGPGPGAARDGARVRRAAAGRGGPDHARCRRRWSRRCGRTCRPTVCCTSPGVPTTSSCAPSTSRPSRRPGAVAVRPGCRRGRARPPRAGAAARRRLARGLRQLLPRGHARMARAPHRQRTRPAAGQRRALTAPRRFTVPRHLRPSCVTARPPSLGTERPARGRPTEGEISDGRRDGTRQRDRERPGTGTAGGPRPQDMGAVGGPGRRRPRRRRHPRRHADRQRGRGPLDHRTPSVTQEDGTATDGDDRAGGLPGGLEAHGETPARRRTRGTTPESGT